MKKNADISFALGVLHTIKLIEKGKISTEIEHKYIVDKEALAQLKRNWQIEHLKEIIKPQTTPRKRG